MVLGIAFDGMLHGDPTVEHYVNGRRYMENMGDGGRSRISTKRMAGESAISLDEAFNAYVFKGSLLDGDNGDLSKLCCKQQSNWVAKRVFWSSNVVAKAVS
jgi:hypothetical protein